MRVLLFVSKSGTSPPPPHFNLNPHKDEITFAYNFVGRYNLGSISPPSQVITIALLGFWAELLQLSHDTVCDVGNTLGVQCVHHALHYIHPVFDGETNEICVH